MFGVFTAAVFGVRRVVGMCGVFARVLRVGALITRVLFVSFCSAIRCSGGRLDGSRIRQRHRRQRLARLNIAMLVISMIGLVVSMFMIVRVLVMLMMLGVGVVRLGIVIAYAVQVFRQFLAFLAFMRRRRLGRRGACVLDDLALDALAIAAPARVAVAWTAAIGAVFALLLGLAMGAFIRLDQRLAIGDRNLVIVGVDFAEGQKTVAVAAVLDEGRLQRRLYAGDLGEIDVAAELLALGGLEIKFFDAIAADHNNPGLFRVGGVDQHFVGHFGTHDGGGRVVP